MSAARVFISYSHRDTTFAHMLERILIGDGISAWVDRQRLVGGGVWREELQQAIEDCDALVLVMTPSALKSVEVRKEYTLALSLGKAVIPLLRGPVRAVPEELRRLQWHDCAGQRITRGVYDLLYTLDTLGISITSKAGVLNVDLAIVRVIHGPLPAVWQVFRVDPLWYRRWRNAAAWTGFAALLALVVGAMAIIIGLAAAGWGVIALALLFWVAIAILPVSACAIVWAHFRRLLSLQDVPEVALVTEDGFAFSEIRFWGTVALRQRGYNFSGMKRLETRSTWRGRARLTIWPFSAASPVRLLIPARFGDTFQIARVVMGRYETFHRARGTLGAAVNVAPGDGE